MHYTTVWLQTLSAEYISYINSHLKTIKRKTKPVRAVRLRVMKIKAAKFNIQQLYVTMCNYTDLKAECYNICEIVLCSEWLLI